MGEDMLGIKDAIVYIDGKEFKGIESFNMVTVNEERESHSNKYINNTNQEFNLELKHPIWFKDDLGKYYYLMNNSKKLRIRKKNKKLYGEKLMENINKLFGL